MDDLTSTVSAQDINDAYARLLTVVRRTELQPNDRLSKLYECEVYLKREDLQSVRSYKIRGAYNLMSQLSSSERDAGIVCASAGNHAQGVALTCALLGVCGSVYMPQNTPRQKIDRVRAFGGDNVEIELIGDTFDDTYAVAAQYSRETGKTFVHPFDDPRIVAGQGTVACEIAEQLGAGNEPDFIFAPVGGGGLVSGISVFSASALKQVKIVGVEPAGAACLQAAMANHGPITLEAIDTFVDGAAVRRAGELPYNICSQLLPELVTVTEGAICTELIKLYQTEGVIAEPAGALSVTALAAFKDRIIGKRVVCIISGGNNDISRYPEILERSLIDQGLKHYFLIEFPQRPGALRRYLDEALGPDDDITVFEYIKKSNREYGPALVGVELTRNSDYLGLVERMKAIGLRYEVISRDSALFRFVL